MCPVKTVGNQGDGDVATCEDITYHPSGMLIFNRFAAGRLLTTSMPSMMKMEVAPMSTIAWLNAIAIAFWYSCVGLPHNNHTTATNNGPEINLIA